MSTHVVPAPTDLLACTAVIPAHVVYRDMVTETVVLNLETGRYHGLNPVGGRILEALASSLTVGDAASGIAEQCDEPGDKVERDVCAFCSDLAARGLIELHANGRP